VLYLLDNTRGRRYADTLLSDNHWRPQNDLCHPCYMRFNFIGHYETLVDDALFILHRLGVADRVQFPNVDPDNRWKRKTADVVRTILDEISPAELDRVRELYRIDLELFGYDNQIEIWVFLWLSWRCNIIRLNHSYYRDYTEHNELSIEARVVHHDIVATSRQNVPPCATIHKECVKHNVINSSWPTVIRYFNKSIHAVKVGSIEFVLSICK